MESTIDSLVSRIVLREFADDEYERVVALLSKYGTEKHHFEPNRVRLSILKLANGDMFSLERQLKVACTDFRDVVAAAEMPGQYKLGFTGMERLTTTELNAVQSQDRKQYQAWRERAD
jgi:hypothetical protein